MGRDEIAAYTRLNHAMKTSALLDQFRKLRVSDSLL